MNNKELEHINRLTEWAKIKGGREIESVLRDDIGDYILMFNPFTKNKLEKVYYAMEPNTKTKRSKPYHRRKAYKKVARPSVQGARFIHYASVASATYRTI